MLARIVDSLRSYWRGPYNLKSIQDSVFSDYAPSVSGVQVNAHSAFTCSAFWDGVNQISFDVAKLPLDLKKRRKEGGSDDFSDSKVYKILKYAPNPEMVSVVFRQTLTAWALVYGNGYAEIQRDGAGQPVALWPIHPSRVEPYYDKTLVDSGRRFPLRYKVDGSVVLAPRDIIHIKGHGCDGVVGYDLLEHARQALGLALASERFAAAFFGNGTRFGGILTSDQLMDDEQVDALRERINAMHAASDKAFKLLIIDKGFTFTETGVKPNDAQMAEIRNQQVVEVARFLNMPPHKLKALDRSTNNNIEHQGIEYLTGCLMNWITAWEQELCFKLISPLEMSQQFIKHNVKAILRADMAAQAAFYSAMINLGIMSADEVRDLEDMNPQPNGQGKTYFIQGAMVPKDKIGLLVDSTITKNTAKPESPAAPAPADPAAPIREQLKAAEEARDAALATAEAERDLRVALEATGKATDAELTRRHETETQALAIAAQMTAMTSDLRQQIERTEADIVARTAAQSAEESARIAAEQRSAESATLAAEAMTARAQAEQAAAEANLAADAAKAQAEEAVSAMGDALVLAERAGLDKAASDALRADAEQKAAEALVAANAATAESVRLQAELVAAAERERQARADATAEQEQARANAEAYNSARVSMEHAATAESERLRAELAEAERVAVEAQKVADSLDAAIAERDTGLRLARADYDAQRAAHDETSAAHQATLATLATLEAERLTAILERDELRTLATAETEARARFETAIRELEQAEADRHGAQIAAHRALMVDVMRRMVERETDRARRASQTPEKLRHWLESFYDGHEDLCRTALLPAVRIHCAFVRSVEDPVDATRRLVATHVDESKRQILTVLDGDADDMAASLPALLHRWESERVAVIADKLLQREIDYARQK